MKSRKQFLTEPEEQRWLNASPWAAIAGGTVVILLLIAMAVFTPGENPAHERERAYATMAEMPIVTVPLPPLPSAADTPPAPEEQPPTF